MLMVSQILARSGYRRIQRPMVWSSTAEPYSRMRNQGCTQP